MILTTPLYLCFLILLPALWWLVRALPPRPYEQCFPPTFLLHQLRPQHDDARHTPLWLLLLRLCAVTSLITAFAEPVLLPPLHEKIPQKLVLILDNGWAAYPHWTERLQTARALTEQSLRIGGSVTLLLTARNEDGQWPTPFSLPDTNALRTILARLHPQNWAVERQSLAQHLTTPEMHAVLKDATVILLSDSVADGHEKEVLQALSTAEHIEDIRWPSCDVVRLHRLADDSHRIIAETLPGCATRPLPLSGLILAQDSHFRTIAHWTLQTGHPFTPELPTALHLSLNALRLDTIPAPEGMLLLNAAQQHAAIGLLHLSGDNTPLTGSAFYLTQALDTLGPLHKGDSTTLLKQPLSLLIAPDGSITSTEEKQKIRTWVQQGGMLVRFAGNTLAQDNITDEKSAENNLLPVPLLHGMRQLDGPMSWGTPQTLASFAPESPFAGLYIPSDVTISRQLLAQPSEGLQQHVLATLADGTPLVTARKDGKGIIVLFHITPTANWSSLPLSGLFPQMLERLINKATTITNDTSERTTSVALPAWKILDQKGILHHPSSTVTPLMPHASGTMATEYSAMLSPFHPAGFYGTASTLHPLNLDDQYHPLQAEPLLGKARTPDLLQTEHPLGPLLTELGLSLLLLDGILSLRRHGAFSRTLIRTLAFFLPLLPLSTLHAAEKTPPAAALETKLAYIKTGDEATNTALQEGLDGLSHFVNQRSTAHFGTAAGVVPGQDDLAFYPLLYWPILPHASLEPEQRNALNDYMHHGGLLVIDEMGADSLLDGNNGATTHAALKRVTEGLDIPPLVSLDDQHVLTRSFYLLHQFPGRVTGQPVYIARSGNDDGDNVSPVILGNSDWIHAWAVNSTGDKPFAVIPGGEHQRVLAYRFGMNMIMYALTGNYKNDQRLYPEMLHRLKNVKDEKTMEDAP